jgi:hypothetical protein
MSEPFELVIYIQSAGRITRMCYKQMVITPQLVSDILKQVAFLRGSHLLTYSTRNMSRSISYGLAVVGG